MADKSSGEHVTVIGGGAWGTALACAVLRAGSTVSLWARNAEVVAALNEGRGNPIYLPEIALPDGIRATTDMAEALAPATVVLLVVPSQHLRGIAEQMQPHMGAIPLALCSKGVERSTGALMSDVAADALPQARVAVLSGPTFAAEVAKGLPTAVTLASQDADTARQLVDAIGAPTFRPYASDDVIGAEIGGAVKNVLAIACGIITGRRLGENARAALITRGLSEISRLGTALGGRRETVHGLSCMGDLTLTCSSPQSRNMSFGIELGQGRKVADILAERRSVTEGVWSAASVTDLAASLGVEMPICEAINRIVTHDADIDETISGLLNRPFRVEGD